MDNTDNVKDINKKYYIDDVEFKNPFLNASGCWVINKEQIMELHNSKLGGIVSKTCTLFSKNGNNEPNYYYDEINDIRFNCKGLPNNGYNYYRNITPFMNKPFFLSVALDKMKNFLTILEDYNNYSSNANENKNKYLVEINISCPNVENKIPGYHLDEIEYICSQLSNLKSSVTTQTQNNTLIFGLKLPPYFEIYFIEKLANKLNLYNNVIKFITMSNSIPYTLPIYNNEFVLSNKYGGLSGKINKYISMGNIYTIKKLLKDDIKVISCGGINDIQDIIDYQNFRTRNPLI
jgi:dihydroorotate dehydrogenase